LLASMNCLPATLCDIWPQQPSQSDKLLSPFSAPFLLLPHGATNKTPCKERRKQRQSPQVKETSAFLNIPSGLWPIIIIWIHFHLHFHIAHCTLHIDKR